MEHWKKIEFEWIRTSLSLTQYVQSQICGLTNSMGRWEKMWVEWSGLKLQNLSLICDLLQS